MFRRSTNLSLFCLLVTLLAATASSARGDIAFPTRTKVYFYDAKGKPIRSPIDFTITCFGYAAYPNSPRFHKPYPEPGTFTPEIVKTIKAECANFGCEIADTYYMNYIRIDSCDLSGSIAGKPFSHKNYASSPIDMSKCKWSADQKRECTATFKLPR
jgi:hypothetical protein